MSKPLSELFDGTKGAIAFRGDAEAIIASRVDGMDLRAHPVAQKQLNARTRRWSESQRREILSKLRPTFKGRPLEAHHAYSARMYPHLANRGEVIYPATHDEHHKGWHGGNYRKSVPGKRIRRLNEF